MLVANYVSINPNMSNTRTREDFYKFIGEKPARMGIVSRMYEDLTLTYLTEGLRNIFENERKASNNFQSINSMMFEWDIETNYIKKIEFADVPTQTGANGSEICMAFTENYYQKYDIFRIEKSRQQCQVVSRPIRKADNYWEVTVRLIDNDYSSVLDTDACQIGDTTVFQSNAFPELSEEGYIKYQSSVEHHRNFITTFRNDDSYSSLYAAMEDHYISVGKDTNNKADGEVIYKMDRKEKTLLDNFMYARNTGLLMNKGNVDVNGKATISEPDTNRPIYIGEGLIPQVEAFASKYVYNKMSLDVFQTIIQQLNEKAEKPTGNHYNFVVNEAAWYDIQRTLGDYLANFQTDGNYIWSKQANGYVKVGASYNTYDYAGNTIQFTVDRTLTREFGNKGYMLCLDLTADKASGKPAVAMFTLKNGQFIQNKVLGVGGESGVASGEVSSAIAGGKLIIMGYAGVACFNPYRTFIARQF